MFGTALTLLPQLIPTVSLTSPVCRVEGPGYGLFVDINRLHRIC